MTWTFDVWCPSIEWPIKCYKWTEHILFVCAISGNSQLIRFTSHPKWTPFNKNKVIVLVVFFSGCCFCWFIFFTGCWILNIHSVSKVIESVDSPKTEDYINHSLRSISIFWMVCCSWSGKCSKYISGAIILESISEKTKTKQKLRRKYLLKQSLILLQLGARLWNTSHLVHIGDLKGHFLS